jgi:hypothetical protein
MIMRWEVEKAQNICEGFDCYSWVESCCGKWKGGTLKCMVVTTIWKLQNKTLDLQKDEIVLWI